MGDHPVGPIAGVVSDLDGVVYRGDAAIPDAVEAFARWRRAGVPACFVTNNATRTPESFAAKLSGLGVPTEPWQVVTSPVAAAAYLGERWPGGTTAYVVGAPALEAALVEAGHEVTERRPAVVVVGLDRGFTYAKLRTAVRAVRAGAVLVGTNPDLILPVEDGFDPGAGALLAAIASASGVRPTIVGKPEPRMVEIALGRLGTPPDATVMIGDQAATDIAAGRAAGLRSILVTTGVPGEPSGVAPDATVDSLLDLF